MLFRKLQKTGWVEFSSTRIKKIVDGATNQSSPFDMKICARPASLFSVWNDLEAYTAVPKTADFS